MTVYTPEIHAARLRDMLLYENEYPCSLCPATAEFSPGEDPRDCWASTDQCHPCQTCQEFLDLEFMPVGDALRPKCPCDRLGEGEAVERSKEKLIKWGYLERWATNRNP